VSEWFVTRGAHEVAPGLWQGALPADADDVRWLAGRGVGRVLNLCQDLEYEPGERDAVTAAYAAAGIDEARLPSLDHGGLLPGLLERAVQQMAAWRAQGAVAYVHCLAGQERSAAVAAAVVAAQDGCSPREAVERVRRARRSARPLPHQLADLDRWWAARAASGPARP